MVASATLLLTLNVFTDKKGTTQSAEGFLGIYSAKYVESIRLENLKLKFENAKLRRIQYDFDSLRRVPKAKVDEDIRVKIFELENRVKEQDTTILGLRQALNPFKPDEVLTIARIKDEVNKLKDANSSLTNQDLTRQQNFEDSIKRELDNSSKNSYLILAVLIPLVLNFLYTV